VPRLQPRDLEAILELSLEARSFHDPETFRAAVVPGVRRLVPCDAAAYNELDFSTRTAWALHDPADALGDDVPPHFARLMHQHPLAARVRAGDRSAHAISDFLSERAYHRLELYNDVFRGLGVEDQMAIGLPGDAVIGIAFNRSRRTFTERDRDVLDVLRPHLAEAYGRVRERALAAALMAAMDASLEERGAAVLLLDACGRVAGGSACARELLAAYAGRSPRDGERLPGAPSLEDPSMTLTGPRGRLRMRALDAGAPAGWVVLLLQEDRVRAPSVESLRELGLTRREAEVLRLLACGKANRQIAAELGIGVGTVRKHLEHVYDHLGVRSRAQAIARVLA
jgi:DNA-binding CsgD family transcriptional regulator